MEYQLTIVATSMEELNGIIAKLNGEEVAEETASPAKNKKQKPTAEEDPAEETAEDDLTGEADEVTADSLRSKISQLAQAGKRDDVKKVLAKFKAATLKDVKSTDYVKFDQELDKIKA